MPNPWNIIGWLVLFGIVVVVFFLVGTYADFVKATGAKPLRERAAERAVEKAASIETPAGDLEHVES